MVFFLLFFLLINWNGIDANLNRAAPTVSTFTEEIPTMKQKLLNADFIPLALQIMSSDRSMKNVTVTLKMIISLSKISLMSLNY